MEGACLVVLPLGKREGLKRGRGFLQQMRRDQLTWTCAVPPQQPPSWFQQGAPAEDHRYRPLPLPEDHAAPLQERLPVRYAGQEDGAELEVSAAR